MIKYTTSKAWATRCAKAYENVTGHPAKLFRDGNSWRVQHDGLSHDAADIIDSWLNAGERSSAITADRVLAEMDRLGMH